MLDSLTAISIDTLGPAGPLIAVGSLAVFLLLVAVLLLLKSKSDPMEPFKQSCLYRATSTQTPAVLREKGRNDKLNNMPSSWNQPMRSSCPRYASHCDKPDIPVKMLSSISTLRNLRSPWAVWPWASHI